MNVAEGSVTVAAALFRVLVVANDRSGTRTYRTANGGTFKGASGLVADDAAGGSTEETAGKCTALGVGTGWFGAVRERKRAKAGNDDEIQFFHSAYMLHLPRAGATWIFATFPWRACPHQF